MNQEAESFRRATMRLLRMQLNSVTIMDIFAYGGAAVGIVVALLQLGNGASSIFATLAVVLLSVEFFLPMRTLGSYFHTAMNGMSAADRMFEILEIEEGAQGTKQISGESAGIECTALTYSYDGKRNVLNAVDFAAPSGSLTGIVGVSGSDKSTLASIISGVRTGFEGEVRIAGVNVREIDPASLAKAVTVVSFDAYLFSGTVRENLLLANPHASDKLLWNALRECREMASYAQAAALACGCPKKRPTCQAASANASRLPVRS